MTGFVRDRIGSERPFGRALVGERVGIVVDGGGFVSSTILFNEKSHSRVLSESGVTVETIEDEIVEVTSSNALVFDYEIHPYITNGVFADTWQFESLTPDICSVSDSGYVSFVSEGIGQVAVTSVKQGVCKTWVKQFRVSENDSLNVLGYREGSLRSHCISQIDTRLEDKTVDDISLFTDYTDPTVRNADCWLGDVDLSGISPWNSYSANKRAGTLISPQHIIYAAHYPIPNGTTIRFVTMDDQIVTRTTVSRMKHPKYNNNLANPWPDLCISLLDEPITQGEGITPINIMPYADSIPDETLNILTGPHIPNGLKNVPVICLNQEEEATISRYNSNYHQQAIWSINEDIVTSRHGNLFYNEYLFEGTRYDTYRIFEGYLVIGDSGNPSFVLINNTLVLLTLFTYGGPGSGTSVSSFSPDIQIMMDELSDNAGETRQSLTYIDLENFNTY